jgi:hypothetical protein
MPDMTAALNAAASDSSPSPAASAPVSAPAPQTPSAPPAQPSTPSSSTTPSAPSAPAAGASGAVANPAPAGGSETFVSVRDALRQFGFPGAESFQDDHSALTQLVMRARQAEQLQQLAQYGNVYLQNQQVFQEALRARQEADQRQQAQAQQWFKAPEWDPSWRSQIVKDPVTGELKPAQGAPPDIVQKYLTGLQHQQGFLEKFAFNPIDAIKPGIEQIVRDMAQQIAGQQLGQYQEKSYAQGFVSQHKDWLFQTDGQGQPVRDPFSGQTQLSPWGQRFREYMGQAMQLGIQGEQQRSSYALQLVKGDYLAYQLQQQQAQAAGDAGKQALLARGAQQPAAPAPAAHNPPASGAASVAPGRGSRSRSLTERLRENMAKANVSLPQTA